MKKIAKMLLVLGVVFPVWAMASGPAMPVITDYQDSPIFTVASSPPLVMLVMGRDHKLYYEAYNDASDLDGDGTLDIGYKGYPGYGGKPYGIDYYGYFDSYKCYEYKSSASPARFEPVATTTDKTCTGTHSDKWSGDFLNYLTMSRMDTLRKVLYGGHRSVDTTSETVLQRSYIPQDAHSWGKEYESVERDGYDIRKYAPLDLPVGGTRHLFANTTLNSDSDPPFLRVLNDSKYRIWNWVAKERPVAGSTCQWGDSHGASCTYGAGMERPSHPTSTQTMQDLVDDYGTEDQKCGTGALGNAINTTGSNNNPFSSVSHCGNDYYMTIIKGKIYASTAGEYQFATNGDDAVEFRINNDVISYWYSGHGSKTGTALQIANAIAAESNAKNGTVYLEAGWHSFEFRHEELTGGDNYQLLRKPPGGSWGFLSLTDLRNPDGDAGSAPVITTYSLERSIPASTMVDYHVRAQVCKTNLLEANCKPYVNASNVTTYKPVGILQKNGEMDQIYFGLMTGSYAKNMSGGVVRKNMGSIKDEINLSTGQFTSVNGIIRTIGNLRISDFRYNDHVYGGGWITRSPMSSGAVPDWGNPVAEMMYETLRYFADGKTATPAYDYNFSDTSTKDYVLGLPKVSWTDPFVQGGENLYCSKPIMLLISDINPSFDTDELPGSAFAATGWSSGAVLGGGTLHVQNRLNEISNDIKGKHFIGQVGNNYDTACSPKDVDGLGNIRGLCPEEPTKQGGYYAGAVAHYGRNTDLRPDLPGRQEVDTYSVALSSPLPEIRIPVADQIITMVPFGKSVGQGSTSWADSNFQPTNTIVDFFVEEITPTSGRFRINFEDVEQGADHDMDAIVRYEYRVTDDEKVEVTVTGEYAAGSIIQHMGYIISGTTADGIYLEVRDLATSASNDPDYFLDTPPGVGPNQGSHDTAWKDGQALPFYGSKRTFTPSTESAATLLKDPLWYAAKWGSGENWDKDDDGVPDNYYYVINPLQLENQLSKAFANILEKAGSGTSASVLATNRRGDGNILQAYFRPTIPNHEGVKWLGYLQNLWMDSYGNIREDTSGPASDGSYSLNTEEDKIIVFETSETGDTTVKKYNNGSPPTSHSISEIKPIWEAGEKLLSRSAADRKIYTFTGSTKDSAGGVALGSSTTPEFKASNLSFIQPFLGVYCPGTSCNYTYLGAHVQAEATANAQARAEKLINYIRGVDAEGLRPRTIRNINTNEKLGVWKLGDIVNSSPVIVSRPQDQYHLLYGDKGYQTYYNTHKNRETVVYVGANDGMLHAFTSWTYDSANRKYTKPSGTTEDIGDELWAYIPQSVLPHLKWLADPDYSHSYYVDLMPLVADVKIDGDWKTLLIGGLRLGGKSIDVHENFGDGYVNRSFHPTYFCLDVTNPRSPKLMWERTYENMGFSFSLPAVVRRGQTSFDDWYLVFGSGPTDYTGTSNQKARIFVVDLKTGAPSTTTDNDWIYEGDNQGFFASPSVIDKDLAIIESTSGAAPKFSHDHVYFTQSYKDDGAWKGKIYRLNVHATNGPDLWDFRSVFAIDAPMMATLALATDHTDVTKANIWIFGGTGRYIEQTDKGSTGQQYLFGFKDPLYNPGRLSNTDALTLSNLHRVDNYLVTKTKKILDRTSGQQSIEVPEWKDLLGKTDVGKDPTDPDEPDFRDGWYRYLTTPRERCVTKPSVVGGLALMPSFVPNDDVCGFGGDSFLYSLYYKTGTAYFKEIFQKDGTYKIGDEDVVKEKVTLGYGMPAAHFGIHMGEQDGATALIQLGSGTITEIPFNTADKVRSGIINWRER